MASIVSQIVVVLVMSLGVTTHKSDDINSRCVFYLIPSKILQTDKVWEEYCADEEGKIKVKY